jgi:hypothetical protein
MSFKLTQPQVLDHFSGVVSRQEAGGGIEGCMWLKSYFLFLIYLNSVPPGKTSPSHTRFPER